MTLKEEQHLFNKKSIDIAHEFIPAFYILYPVLRNSLKNMQMKEFRKYAGRFMCNTIQIGIRISTSGMHAKKWRKMMFTIRMFVIF